MSQSILYYPTIDISDSIWLRNAVLYWDEVCSIVPYQSYEAFSHEIEILKDAHMYREVYPQELLSSPHGAEFSEAVKARLRPGFRLAGRGGVPIHRNKIQAPVMHNLIHQNKMADNLINFLLQNNYLVDYNCDGWMEMDVGAANVYMRTLAEYAAKYDFADMVIGSDRKTNLNAMYPHAAPAPGALCLSLVLEHCLPQPSMDVPFKKLIDFKAKRRQELLQLRQKLYKVERALSCCRSPEELAHEIEVFRESWEIELTDAKKLFHGDQIEFFLGSLTAFIASSATTELWTTMGGPAAVPLPLVAVGGGALGIVYNFLNHKNKLKERREASGFAYLILAHKRGLIKG